MASSSSFYQRVAAVPSSTWASVAASLPVVIWVHDSFFSLCRVRGSSMEPTLKDGDIVVFRKSESFLWRGNDDEGPEKQFEREQVQEWERTHCNQTISPSWFVKKPPLPVTGNIIVYQDPEYYPSRWNIKRVIGLGGQVLMVPSSRFQSPKTSFRMDDKDTSMRVLSPSVPPYSLWVEGDNMQNSYDSRNKNHGPVSKKLLVGIAEFVLWPPTRFGTSESLTGSRNENNDNNYSPKPQSYWP